MRVSLGVHLLCHSNPQADATDVATTIAGLRKRIAIDPLERDLVEVRAFKRFVSRWLDANMPSDLERLEFNDWLESCPYPKGKKVSLAATRLIVEEPGHRLNTEVKLFIKNEPYSEFKHARGIYARHDEFKVVFGPWVKAIERVLYKRPEFIKHIPVESRPEFIVRRLLRNGSRYMATDFTSFESNFDRQLNDACDTLLFEHCFKNSAHFPELRSALDVINGDNRIVGKYLRCRVSAKRMSGEMNTSLSNGFTNLMVFKFLTRKCKYSDCVIEGDDCLAVIEGDFPTKFDYARLGFRIKIETFDDLCEASFCGLIFDLNSMQLLRDPIKYLLNFSWFDVSYVNSSKKTKIQLLRGKALSTLAEMPDCPMVSFFAWRIKQLTDGYHFRVDRGETWFVKEQRKKLLIAKFREPEPTLATRCLFAKLYSISVEAQLFIEAEIKLMSLGPFHSELLTSYLSHTTYLYDNMYVRPFINEKIVQVAGHNKLMQKQKQVGAGRNRRRRQRRLRVRKENQAQTQMIQQPYRPPIARRQRNRPRTGFNDYARVGSMLGTTLGSAFGPGGSALGGAIGGLGGGLLAKVLGRGDYDVKFNTLVKASPVPEFPNANCIRFKHREFIGDVSGSVGFVNTSYSINPGLGTTYPLLYSIASCFQQYSIYGQLFEFVSTSADALNSTNTALGTVIMATDYDALDGGFANKQTMMATLFSNAGKPSESMLHAIECAPSSTPVSLLYTRTGPVPAGGDQRLYDLGNFQIATQGMQAAAVIGELWVTYDIVLCKPILPTNAIVQSDHYVLASNITRSAFWGGGLTPPKPVASSSLGTVLSYDGSSNSVITFPANLNANVYIGYAIYGSSTASVVNPTTVLGGGCSPLAIANGASTYVVAGTGTVGTLLINSFVKVTNGGTYSLTQGTGLIPTSITSGDLWITLISTPMT